MPPLPETLNPLKYSKIFMDGFVASFSIVIFSELFDKTFFIAAIMAMRHSKFVVFNGAALALFLMTVLSASLGRIFVFFFPPHISSILCSLIMLGFGFKIFYEAYTMTSSHMDEEISEVTEEILKKEKEFSEIPVSIRTQSSKFSMLQIHLYKMVKSFCHAVSGPFFQTFIMVFIGEWGDRSQLSTFILAANKNVISVSLGAFLGHCLCTSIAVIGGSLLSKQVSVKSRAISFFFFGTYGLMCTIRHSMAEISIF